MTPAVPEPQPPPAHEEGDGWAHIDRVGAWDALLTEFKAMDEVPAQYSQLFCWAYGEVLQRLQAAQEEGLELDRALKLLCFLPQALCRKLRRGGKSGAGLINKRFNCLAIDKNWGEVERLWEQDREITREERKKKKSKREED